MIPFETFSLFSLFECLNEYDGLLDVNKSVYVDTIAESFEVTEGDRHGCCISPLLFMDKIVRTANLRENNEIEIKYQGA